jgi:TolB-like protein
MQIWSAEIKELETLYTSLKDGFPELEKELEQLIKTEDANVVMLYSRRCLEVIITDLCESELKRPRKTEPLKGIIDKLNREEKVPAHIITSMLSLNSMSTYGTHPKEFDPEQVKPVLSNLTIIIEWYGKHKNIEFIKPIEEKAEAPDKMIIDEDYQISESYSRPKKSIIVLPFENISPDPDQEYFSDGLTEEIITDLSYIDDLLVISRNSAMTFKGTKKKTKEIASEVNVKYVLEGSVRKAGNNLRIVAQLIDAETDAHLWAEKFSATMENVFDVQEKVSRSIAEALKLKLSVKELQRMAERLTDDIRAYECYFKARQQIYDFTQESMGKALRTLENGLEIIGESGILYAGKALVYIYFYELGIKADEETLKKAEEFLDKVKKLKPDSHQYYYLLGRIERFRGNAIKAFRYSQAALALESNDPENLMLYSYFLVFNAGKPDIAEPYIKKLIAIDPLTQINYIPLVMIYLLRGEIDLILASMRKGSQSIPEERWARFFLSRYLSLNKQKDDAIELIDQIVHENPHDLVAVLSLFSKYTLLEEKDKALQVMTEEVKTYFWNDPDLPWAMADYYALIDEKKQALEWLEHCINRGMINYPLLNEIDPFLNNIRSEPRFKKLMERVKYEWENFEV